MGVLGEAQERQGDVVSLGKGWLGEKEMERVPGRDRKEHGPFKKP